MANMADEANERAHGAGGAAKRTDIGDKDHAERETGAGREAVDDAPRDHPREHQSNYGGGGVNGGSK